MKKAVTLFIIGLVIAFVYFLFTGEDKKAQAIFTGIVISLGIGITFSDMPKQEGAMKKAITLIVIGFAIAIPGWLIAAFAHSKPGAVLFVIGWLIGATGMVMALWKNEYQNRWLGMGMKICVIGISVLFLGALLEVPEDMETLSNTLVKIGQYVFYAGMFVGFLGVIEDNMR